MVICWTINPPQSKSTVAEQWKTGRIYNSRTFALNHAKLFNEIEFYLLLSAAASMKILNSPGVIPYFSTLI